ncbi:hypothetical protein DVU_1297 [Nitratidesulfovibrio vulgaris str. Hildenborough]|uniref:Uncharacterized protein n=1 Tax=Nitratidesulfovibrio vulgaris (strain ATCC 29579 / DSM 644 / CCUG 34227 / NCIMB 8303 / VKM B-1760 / Hildenborough) TaxID=882 RepID=Q72CI6_NITV2|nr:hypothetical protein DVU_1297 [Nitratidesulfovibrio vulgaris str. Hildenborough]
MIPSCEKIYKMSSGKARKSERTAKGTMNKGPITCIRRASSRLERMAGTFR